MVTIAYREGIVLRGKYLSGLRDCKYCSVLSNQKVLIKDRQRASYQVHLIDGELHLWSHFNRSMADRLNHAVQQSHETIGLRSNRERHSFRHGLLGLLSLLEASSMCETSLKNFLSSRNSIERDLESKFCKTIASLVLIERLLLRE